MVEAIVEFNYTAQEDDELTIAVGDIIRNIRKDEEGWWEGELDGRRGMFPDNFVKELKKEGSQEFKDKWAGEPYSIGSSAESEPKPDKKGDKKRRCKVTFSYTPQNDDELALKIGDIIEILEEVEEGWWEGHLNGKIGMFPSNFIKELVEEAEDSAVEDSSGSGLRGSPGTSLSQREDTESSGPKVLNTSEIQPKKLRGVGFGDIFKEKPIKLRPHSMDIDSSMEKQLQAMQKSPQVSVTEETKKTEADNKVKASTFCKVVFSYEAQNKDELSIKEGDIVAIVSKECADPGWWLGELDGRRGVFPDNFVKLLEVDGEKERPKKPPPPSTSATKPRTDRKPGDAGKAAPERPESLARRRECKGDEVKPRIDIPKPGPPVIPPKKPNPHRSFNSSSLPAVLPTKRLQKPERPPGPNMQLEGGAPTPGHCSLDQSSHIEVEDFDSIVTCSEKLNHPTASRPRMKDRRPHSQAFASTTVLSSEPLDSCTFERKRWDADDNEEQDSVLKNHDMGKKPSVTSTSGASGGMRPCSPSVSGLTSDSRSKSELLGMEELWTQLKDLRGSIELTRRQHKKEITQLMNELDEEKKIRLSLQMEVERIKKVLSK